MEDFPVSSDGPCHICTSSVQVYSKWDCHKELSLQKLWPLQMHLPLLVTSLQLYGLSHIYGYHQYPLYILIPSIHKFPNSNLLLNHAESIV